MKTIAKVVNDVFIPRGINVPSLDMVKAWEYAPANGLKVGDHITGGDIYGVRLPLLAEQLRKARQAPVFCARATGAAAVAPLPSRIFGAPTPEAAPLRCVEACSVGTERSCCPASPRTRCAPAGC